MPKLNENQLRGKREARHRVRYLVLLGGACSFADFGLAVFGPKRLDQSIRTSQIILRLPEHHPLSSWSLDCYQQRVPSGCQISPEIFLGVGEGGRLFQFLPRLHPSFKGGRGITSAGIHMSWDSSNLSHCPLVAQFLSCKCAQEILHSTGLHQVLAQRVNSEKHTFLVRAR